MMLKINIGLLVLSIVLNSCSKGINADDLYGKWNYIAVENFNPPDSLSSKELIEQAPAIIFSKGNKLEIEWGGKQLSHGTYQMDGKMIRYTESLDGGRKREFPFLIKELGENKLVFETMEQNYTRIKAKKR
jgi:hypothetical protein